MTPNLTTAGRNILLRALAGDTIKFTKVKLGNGGTQDHDKATDLNNPLLTLPVSSITIGTNYVTLVTAFSNSNITSGFHITEAGFYVEDPDNPKQEVLYALGNEPESSSDYIPPASNRIVEMQYNALIFIGDAENVSAAINSSLVYVTQDAFEAHLKDYSNPHRVSKANVGLGNVPNVTTNNQTPTFTEATTLTALNSGETLYVLFGKLKKAVSSLVSHLNDKNNPHGVTPSLIGAAKTSHTHSASDINAGILPVSKGGTGYTTLADLKRALDAIITATYITASNANQFFTRSYSGYTMTNSSGNNWTFGNIGVDSSTSNNYFTAKQDCKVTVRYTVSLEQNYDWLYLYVNGSQQFNVTGIVSGSKVFNLTKGQQFYLQLSKDINQNAATHSEENTASVTIYVETT